jgi:hypothetical protein
VNETKKSNTFLYVVIAGIVLWYLYSQGKLDSILKPSTPAPSAPTVPANLQAAAEPIKAIAAKNPAIAKDLGQRYLGFADVVRRDDGKIRTTEQVRSFLIDADALAIRGTPIVGSLTGFGAAKDAVVKTAIGMEPVPMDAAKRVALADALTAVSVALGAN